MPAVSEAGNKLQALRVQIDQLDEELLALINRRADLAKAQQNLERVRAELEEAAGGAASWQMAPPGAIWVAEPTYRVASEAFVWKAEGSQPVKGKAEPVAVVIEERLEELQDERGAGRVGDVRIGPRDAISLHA